MIFDTQRKLALRRARLALGRGNLDEACQIMSQPALRELRQGQELCYELAEALCTRAREHAACENLPEALVDLNRAVTLGGKRPEAVKLRNDILERLSPSPCGGGADGARSSCPGQAARRYVLWLDGVGTFVIFPFPRVSVGRGGSSARPDIPLTGRIPGIAAEVIRTGEQYLLCAHGPVMVNERNIGEKVLASGDRIRISESPELRFYLPCPMSSTAVLRIGSPSLLPGKALDAILLDQFLVIGTKGFSHIRTTSGPRQLVLVLRGGTFRAKCEGPILGAGDTMTPGTGPGAAADEHQLVFGKRIAIDGLSFTLTEG